MSSVKDRFTATLSRPRAKEVMDRRPGLIALHVLDADGERDVVIQGPRASAGAHADNGLVLRDDAISNIHFELEIRDDGVALRDLGSKNGTWLGTARVRDVWLRPGTRFNAGGCAIDFVANDPVEVPISTEGRFGKLYGRGSKMGELFSKLERLASIPLDVLLVGETGTGKELAAQALHTESDRKDGPFKILDCTNVNEGIAESTLFGHKKGAFTNALADQAGLLEESNGGTLFIDEIGELPMRLQPKLLRALESHETCRVGETVYRSFDARIVAATNRDLRRMVNEGSFRADLYFRLAQMQVEIPPLRDRGKRDITLLADLFLDRFAKECHATRRFERACYEALTAYSWPGNVRELRNVVRYVAMWTQTEEVTPADLPPLDMPGPEGQLQSGRSSARTAELEESLLLPLADGRIAYDRIYAARILAESGNNQSEGARRSGMSRSAFRELLKRVGLVE